MVVGTIVTSAPISQDEKIPCRGNIDANATSRPSLTTDEAQFSTGTQTARRSPVRTASCSTKMHQVAVAPTNRNASAVVSSTRSSEGTSRRPTNRNAALSSAATTTLVAYEERIRRSLVLPATGMKRRSALERLSCAIPAISVVAEIAAEFRPTFSAEYWCAATTQ